MIYSLRYKLLAALLLTSIMVAAGLFFFLEWRFERAFLGYVDKVEEAQLSRLGRHLGPWYEKYGGWDFLKGNYPLWYTLNASVFTQTPTEEGGAEVRLRLKKEILPVASDFPRQAGGRVVLYDGEKNFVVGGESEAGQQLKEILFQGRIIGYLGLVRREELTRLGDRIFAGKLRRIFSFVAVVMLGGTLLLTFPVMAVLLRPVKRIAEGTRRLTGGDYSTRIPGLSRDELGQLAGDFNVLADTLEKNQSARRQWVADISHELRTPLSILRGEFEAMRDGIRPLSMETVERLCGRVVQLQRLTDDLYELSMSDIGALTYTKESLDILFLLEETLFSSLGYCEDKGLGVTWQLPANRPLFFGDAVRLRQVFSNLLHNSTHYTDPPGQLQVVACVKDGELQIIFQDSAPGVAAGARARLFERLYRVDAARTGEGGSRRRAGLGLSICRNIIEGHSGRIEAHDSPLGGLKICIFLPV